MEITFFDEQDKIELTQQMKEAVKAALGAAEHDAGVAACVNLLFTDDEGICALNREFRGIDSATDVLSFPAYELGELLEDSLDEIDAEYIEAGFSLAISRYRSSALCCRRKSTGTGWCARLRFLRCMERFIYWGTII